MISTNFFNYLSSRDKYPDFLLPNKSNLAWIEALENHLKLIELPKGRLLAINEQIPNDIYFLEKGAVKGYVFYKNKMKKVLYLWEGPAIVGDLKSFFYETTTKLNIEIVQDSTLVRLDRNDINSMVLAFPKTELFLKSILLKYLSYCEEEYLYPQKLKPFEKFEMLFSTRKGIDLVFSKTDIASKLDISRSTFNVFYNRLRH